MKMRWLLLLFGLSAGGPLLSQAREHWEFGNFGPGSAGRIRYDDKKLVVTTGRTRYCFTASDSYSFAWRQQPFPYDDCSESTVTVSIDRFSVGTAGIMMRSAARPDAANAHLEVTPTGEVILFARKADGESTAYTYLTNLSFPISLKLVRQGDLFTGYYKSRTGEWTKGASMVARAGTEPLVGFYACSGTKTEAGHTEEPNDSTQVAFSDWTVAYKEDWLPPEEHFTDRMPVREGTLLRDNFDDGSLSNGPASTINPIWNGIQYGYLPHDPAGGRYWRKTGDGTYRLGNKKWTDYEVSVDLTVDTGSRAPGEFMLQVRYQDIAIYAALTRYYAIGIRDGNKLFFEKVESGAVSWSKLMAIPRYFDGKRHRLKVRLLDRDYAVYYDDQPLITGTDTIRPITYGNIAVKFTNVAIDLDNLEVTSIDDPVNGAAQQPALFHVTTAETRPGDAVLLRGEYLDKIARIELCRLTDSSAGEGLPQYVPLPREDRLIDPDRTCRRSDAQMGSGLQMVDRLQQGEQSVKFIIPAAWREGVYSVRLISKDKGVTGFYLNTPIVNWVISEEGRMAVRGGYLRIQGKNLWRKGVTGQIALISSDGHTVVRAGVEKAFDDFSVSVNIPADIPEGDYWLYYHNGLGGKTAWSEPMKITVVAPSPARWDARVLNVKDFGARGDGINNETAAFQAALDAAGQRGGGTVYVPRGRYMLTGQLILTPYTMLKGESAALTQLFWNPLNWDTNELPNSLISGTHHFAVKDLNLWASRAWGVIMQTGPVGEQGDVTLENLVVRQTAELSGMVYQQKANRDVVEAELNSRWMKTGISLQGENIKLRNCDFNSAGMFHFFAVSGFIQHCRFTRNGTGINQPYMAIHPKGLIFEDCYKQADGYGYAASIDESHDLYEARNTTPFDYTNDREAMTFDGGSGAYFGPVGSAAGTILTLPAGAVTNQWTPNKWIGGGVFIIEGKGAGQYRRIRSHTLDSIRLDQPFLVEPDASSVISITTIRRNFFFVNDEVSDAGAYQFYGSVQDAVISGLRMSRCNGITGRGSLLYHGKQPNWYIELVNCVFREGNYCHWFGIDDRGHSGYQHIDLIGSGGSGLNIGTLIRRNQFEDFSYIRTSPGASPNAVADVVIDDNSFNVAKNAISLGGSGNQTSGVLIHHNHYTEVEQRIETGPGLASGSYLVLDDGVR